jgi:hypothetical protein
MDVKDKAAFEQFLLAEYDHIADAHFNAVGTISEFFKHYVTMIGLPLAAVPIIIKFFPEPVKALANLRGYESLVIIASAIVASIGFCMMLYIVSLHKVSLLYAKTVNGVRNYFYKIAALDPASEKQVRVLPRSINKPRYFRKSFVPTIIAFGLLNGAYPAVAMVLISLSHKPFASTSAIVNVSIALAASVFVHVLAYWLYARAGD